MLSELLRPPERSALHQATLDEAVSLANLYPHAKGFLVLDLDDVLFNTRPQIHGLLSLILRVLNPSTPLPTLQEAHGGLQKLYEGLFHPSDPSVYAEISSRISSNPRTYTDAPLMDENLVVILEELTNAGFIPIMCLSARSENVMEASREELRKFGLPDLPVYASQRTNGATVDMKIGVLKELARLLPGKRLFMIDDHEELIVKLNDLEDPSLNGILYDTPRFNTPGETWGTMRRFLENRINILEE